MPAPLGDHARTLLDVHPFVSLATLDVDGAPNLSVVWATYDGDDVLVSTVAGRQKERNLRRDPRVGMVIPDHADPYRYVEVRGQATVSTEGGRELIDALSESYRGRPYDGEPPSVCRVVVRVTPLRVVEHGF